MGKKINMTFTQALDYILNVANDKKCTDEMYSKMSDFIKMIPHNENDRELKFINGGLHRAYIILKDYDSKKSYHLYYGLEAPENDVIFFAEVQLVDNYGFENKNIASSNEEALSIMNEMKNIKYARDIDEYYEMSDDPSVSRWARRVNDEARAKKYSLLSRL